MKPCPVPKCIRKGSQILSLFLSLNPDRKSLWAKTSKCTNIQCDQYKATMQVLKATQMAWHANLLLQAYKFLMKILTLSRNKTRSHWYRFSKICQGTFSNSLSNISTALSPLVKASTNGCCLIHLHGLSIFSLELYSMLSPVLNLFLNDGLCIWHHSLYSSLLHSFLLYNVAPCMQILPTSVSGPVGL